MRKILIYLGIIASLVCGFFLWTATEVNDSAIVHCKNEQQVKVYDCWRHDNAEEPQSNTASLLRPTPSSHRVVSSRFFRLLPTHGGKPNPQSGRWVKDHPSQLLKYSVLLQCFGRITYSVVSPSRHYYVIALRRLLC